VKEIIFQTKLTNTNLGSHGDDNKGGRVVWQTIKTFRKKFLPHHQALFYPEDREIPVCHT